MRDDEGKTSYLGNEVVEKKDERLEMRGAFDGLLARAVLTSAYAQHFGYSNIISGAQDIVRVMRMLVHADATSEAPQVDSILGMSLDELRDVSYNPKSELGLDHYYPDEHTDLMTAYLNMLRTDIRRTELLAYRLPDGCVPEETKKVLNRLSSAAYILMLECRSERP